MEEPVRRLIGVTLLLLLLVPGLVVASGDGDIPEVRPAPIMQPSSEMMAAIETDAAGMPPADLVTLVLSALLAIL